MVRLVLDVASRNEDTVVNDKSRINSVDLLRGIIMILMALDHVRDYFGDLTVSPTNLATTTPGLFLTRWITHVCAPVFFLLTGTGAFLTLRRMNKGELSRYLITRGLWLILAEVTFIRLLWQFNLDYHLTALTVIWALGWAMVVLGLLVHLPVWAVTTFGLVLIGGHNLLDRVQASTLGSLAPLWNVLHVPGFLLNAPGRVVFLAYPLVPWVGVTAAGFGLGACFAWEPGRRRKFLAGIGLAAIGGFVLLRWLNRYGDPAPWIAGDPTLTVLSFLNTTKYPPSLLFLLMTLGPAILLLALFDRGPPGVLRPAVTIGRVPFFYYLMHILLIHLLAVFASLVRYGRIHWMFQSPTLDTFPVTQPPGWPLDLPAIYLIWIGIVIALYPFCRWFAGVRARRREKWLSYL
jgi:uncharacterized membrane protein